MHKRAAGARSGLHLSSIDHDLFVKIQEGHVLVKQ